MPRPRRRAPDTEEGRARVVLSGLAPAVDAGRFPVQRVVGEPVEVTVDAVADGHDALAVALLWKRETDADWHETPMKPVGNDRFAARFVPTQPGLWSYTAIGWIDRFETWRRDLAKRVAAGQDLSVDLKIGSALLAEAAGAAPDLAATRLLGAAKDVAAGDVSLATDPDLAAVMARHAPRPYFTPAPELHVRAERSKAGFSAWYEMFPRSAAGNGQHGTFADVIARLPYVAGMGFDVLYLPPIHPIGRAHRKGKDNALVAGPDDVGSPWAIGAAEGGHTAIHPQLGTPEDFRKLVAAAQGHGIEIALDIALQCAPDHPWVNEHPEWFRKRPDGTIQYAENPPKKYQDIYPFDFECQGWQALWQALLEIFLHWIGEGVKIFRVDNPHTKSLRFWEWCLAEVRREHPDVLFLSEAFTRPKLQQALTKRGFTWTYTYFTWKNTRHDLVTYFRELAAVRDWLRPHVWPNTPDILNEYLQIGGAPAHRVRAVLAATLSANWGLYGPAYELVEHAPREPGSEEYLHSEKYQIRTWNLDDPNSLAPLLQRLNRIRQEHAALQQDRTLAFHDADDERTIVYSKRSGDDVVLVVANLDPVHRCGTHLTLDLEALGVSPGETFQVHDRLTDARWLWTGSRPFVELDPSASPAHVFVLRRKLRSERDFEYFL
jgi:starch synthase (maltosyl-transferring)